MDKEYFDALAKVRMSRAKELLDDATELLKKTHINQQTIEHFTQWKRE